MNGKIYLHGFLLINLLIILLIIVILKIHIGCTTAKDRRGLSGSIQDTELKAAEHALHLNAEALKKMDLGDLEQAERLFKQAIEADMNCGTVHNNLGSLYFRESKLYLAAIEFQCALKLMPNNPEPANNLGLVYEKAHQLDQAVEWYQMAIEMDPDAPEILGNLARARLRRGDSNHELKKLLERLAVKDPRSEWSKWAEEQAALMQIAEK